MSTVVRTREAARAGGLRALPVAARERPRATFAAICALAAAVFLVDLGRSSFFIDEILDCGNDRHWENLREGAGLGGLKWLRV